MELPHADFVVVVVDFGDFDPTQWVLHRRVEFFFVAVLLWWVVESYYSWRMTLFLVLAMVVGMHFWQKLEWPTIILRVDIVVILAQFLVVIESRK